MISIIAVIWLLEALSIASAQWVVTAYVEIDVSTLVRGAGPTEVVTHTIVPTASPLPAALSTITTSDPLYQNLELIEIFLPSGAGYVSTTVYGVPTPIETSFYVPVTYHPFSTCSGKEWTYITTVYISVPLPAQPFLTPIANSTTTSYYTIGPFDTDAFTSVSALLDPTDVPPDQYSSASSANEPGGVKLCRSPTSTTASATATATVTGEVSSYGITCGPSNPTCEDCTFWTEYCTGDCPPIIGTYLECQDGKDYWITGGPKKHRIHVNAHAAAIAVPVTWGGFWIVIGLWHHISQFKAVMKGQRGRLGGLPLVWACWTLCISTLFAGKQYDGKGATERIRLEEQWKSASWWKKTWWYFRWGWGWSYPSMLGSPPRIISRR